MLSTGPARSPSARSPSTRCSPKPRRGRAPKLTIDGMLTKRRVTPKRGPREGTTMFPPCTWTLVAFLLLAGCSAGSGPGRLSDAPPAPEQWKSTRFLDATECKSCHPVHYREWKTSMHAYAQHSPIFVAFQEFIQARTGGTLGTFCV